MTSLILTALPAQQTNYYGRSLSVMEEKIPSWPLRGLVGRGGAAVQGERALSGIDLRKSQGFRGNVGCTRAICQTQLPAPQEASAGRQAAAVWDWKWLLGADFSDFHSSETV